MPATKIDNVLLKKPSSITADLTERPQQQPYDTFESNPNTITIKKPNKIQTSIKSFWASNLSIASTTSSSSSSQTTPKSNIITSSRKLFNDFLSSCPSVEDVNTNKNKTMLSRSQTMKPTERRRIFNRSSSRNLKRPLNDSAMLNQHSIPQNINLTHHQPIRPESSNLYDKLFVNKKLNATNKKLVKEIDDELSPYSHIYKDFTVDCLKPFFQIEKIEKIQFQNVENHELITSRNLNETTSSSTSQSDKSPKNKPLLTVSKPLEPSEQYTEINEESSSSTNSPSSSLCLSSSSSNSFILRTEEIYKTILTSSEDTEQLNKSNREIPKPHPRSVYLTYENYKRNRRQFLQQKKNKTEPNLTINQNEQEQTSQTKKDTNSSNKISNPFRSHSDLIIPSSSSCSSSNSSSPTKFNHKFTESSSPEVIYTPKIPTSAFTVVNSQKSAKQASSISSGNSESTSSRAASSPSASIPSTNTLETTAKDSKSAFNGQDYEYIKDTETEKKRTAKGRIIDELIQTEMDYYKVMKLLYDVYLGTSSENTIEQSQKETIFCNLQEIMNLSSTMLNDFETYILNRTFEGVNIGKCFLKNANQIKKTYSYFTQYIEYSNNILEKNEKVVEVQQFIQNGLNIIKQQTTSAFDLHSLLLKPIQRVLKYPLLLQELIKNTEPYHEDFENLNQALAAMQHVAMYINEIKRRRELIVKYGRKDKDQLTITDKMSKFTMHSVIKKSNRISMKLSNAFGLNVSTVDEEFDKFESKFHYYEKLIKSFNKDSLQHLSNLKEFFKIQTVTSESIQEYYGEYESSEILQYVRINATVLNEIYTKNLNFVHEKVLQPLNQLLKLLEIPNKLIQKRHDKLLDYECARANCDKNKDKHLVKATQENLYEAQKNYEALNNQLLEELPNLTDKCSYIFDKCFKLYLTALRNIHEKVQCQLKNLIGPNSRSLITSRASSQSHSTSCHRNESEERTNRKLPPAMSRKSERMSMAVDNMRKKRTEFNFKFPVSKLIKNFGSSDSNSLPTPTEPIPKSTAKLKQSDHIRDLLKQTYKENMFKVNEAFTGYGISNDLTVEANDLVGVIKKSDPCGNSEKWFVDNGYVKGIISANILEALTEEIQTDNADQAASASRTPINSNRASSTKSTKSKVSLEDLIKIIDKSDIDDKLDESEPSTSDEVFTTTRESLSRKNSIASFDETTNNDSHDYVNTPSNVRFAKKSEYCRVLYTFESLDETTLTITEGENLKILQKHDDNLNDEWWLVEKIIDKITDDMSPDMRIRGYVPSNYVQLIYRAEIKSQISDHIVLYDE